MIIQLEGDPASISAAQQTLLALTRSWGHDAKEIAAKPTAARTSDGEPGKSLDPVSLFALALSIPSTVLAVLDLADRIRKRRRASELIEHAQELAEQQVTLTLITQTRIVEIRTLTPDQLLDLTASEPDQAD